jgi:hypothetical protein
MMTQSGAQMGAVPPKKGLSYAEANYNGKDEPELERPGTSKGKVNDSHIIRRRRRLT